MQYLICGLPIPGVIAISVHIPIALPEDTDSSFARSIPISNDWKIVGQTELKYPRQRTFVQTRAALSIDDPIARAEDSYSRIWMRPRAHGRMFAVSHNHSHCPKHSDDREDH